jgi:acyl-CoA thioester hydrolase
MQIPVVWNDMDALGHVNNSRYFVYLESARIDFLAKYEQHLPMPDSETGPILAYIDCQYRLPITFPDNLQVNSTVTELGRTSLHLAQEIYSEKFRAVAATSKSVIVLINYKTGEKLPIPEQMRDVLQRMIDGGEKKPDIR